MLNAGAKQVTEEIEIAAGRAIADVVTPGELSADYIVPTVFNPAGRDRGDECRRTLGRTDSLTLQHVEPPSSSAISSVIGHVIAPIALIRQP